MTENKIIELMKMLNMSNIRKRDGWVSASCPFASAKNKYGNYMHSNGTDKRPSFGISVSNSSSYYHCFSCGVKAPLLSLPSDLAFKKGGEYVKARDFIFKNETQNFDDYDSGTKKPRRLPCLDNTVLNNYTQIPDEIREKLNLTQETINRFELKYNKQNQRVIIPIKDEFGRLVGIRGRYVGTNKSIPKFLSYQGRELKSYGIWYNIDEVLIENKILCILESESDLWQLKQSKLIHNMWCSMGAGITSEQIFTLQQVSNPILLFLDNDEAGKLAIEKIIKNMRGLMPLYKIGNYFGEKDVALLCINKKIKQALKSIVKC